MVTIFVELGGGVNLDGEFEDDLDEFRVRHQKGRHAAEIFPGKPKGYRRAVSELSLYAINKATAIRRRAAGDIPNARLYEDICESIYRDLPEFARW